MKTRGLAAGWELLLAAAAAALPWLGRQALGGHQAQQVPPTTGGESLAGGQRAGRWRGALARRWGMAPVPAAPASSRGAATGVTRSAGS